MFWTHARCAYSLFNATFSGKISKTKGIDVLVEANQLLKNTDVSFLIFGSGDHEKELFGGELNTTNNRMELLAAIEALAALKGSSEVKLHTDSKYLKDGIQSWIANWKKNGWKTAAKKPVKNAELWQALDEQCARHSVSWFWVKGHSGHPENEFLQR